MIIVVVVKMFDSPLGSSPSGSDHTVDMSGDEEAGSGVVMPQPRSFTNDDATSVDYWDAETSNGNNAETTNEATTAAMANVETTNGNNTETTDEATTAATSNGGTNIEETNNQPEIINQPRAAAATNTEESECSAPVQEDEDAFTFNNSNRYTAISSTISRKDFCR